MQKITLDDFNAVTKKQRDSVVKKLEAYLNTELTKLKVNDVVKVNARDFINNDNFHYYQAYKLLNGDKYNRKIDTKFVMQDRYRSNAILIRVKA